MVTAVQTKLSMQAVTIISALMAVMLMAVAAEMPTAVTLATTIGANS